MFTLFLTIANCSDRALAENYVPGAKLKHVTEGTFSLKAGQSSNLTDSNVLVTFNSVVEYHPDQFVIRINGRTHNVKVGERFDLKKYTSRLSGRDECWLDFYRAVKAKGASTTASFRLDCP